jgi:DNA-binding NarL/FixJ family response regulator
MPRILLYEDNEHYRESLAETLALNPQNQVLGTYPDCRFLREQVEYHAPDLIILDIEMPHVNGLQGLYLLKKYYPGVRAMVLTFFDDNDKVFEAICLGADGYLLKNTPFKRLLDAIDDTMEGGSPMTPSIARKVLEAFLKTGMKPSGSYDLSEREKAVLRLLVQGKSYKIIAAEQHVSINTIRTQIKSVYEKLRVHSVSEAVAKAIREQIV